MTKHAAVAGACLLLLGCQRTAGPTKTRTLDLGGGVTMELVLAPAGEIMMGSPDSEADRDDDEGPQRRVRFSRPFYMGKYEVTQAQYERIMGANPSRFRGADRPVERVSWEEAGEFCRKLSGQTGMEVRLPTEAEWEYACRAGTETPFHFGGTITTYEVNYNGNKPSEGAPKGAYREMTTPVGSLPANAWGLHDMHGNVMEWCEDDYPSHGYESEPTDGSAWVDSPRCGVRVLRGGSWDDPARDCRSAYRGSDVPIAHEPSVGFRVAVPAAGP